MSRSTARRCGLPARPGVSTPRPHGSCFVGAALAIELLNDIGIEAVHAHNVRLARRFLAGLGLPPPQSAIVTLARPGAAERLAAAGVRAAIRAGRTRLSFHLYTTEADVDRALEALVPYPHSSVAGGVRVSAVRDRGHRKPASR
jgi:selenocysteine lyase/cysteine desulfurase